MENVCVYLNVKLYDKLVHMTMGPSHMSYFLTNAARTHVLMGRFVSLFVTAGIIIKVSSSCDPPLLVDD